MAFFLEWELREIRPRTVAARLVLYLRYCSSQLPSHYHGARPLVPIVFDGAPMELTSLEWGGGRWSGRGVKVPLRVYHRELVAEAGPLGRVWRNPDVLKPACAFG